MKRLLMAGLLGGLAVSGTAARASGLDSRDGKRVRLELSAGPNWLYGPANLPNYGAGVSYTPHPVVSFGLAAERPGYGTAVFAHLKVAPVAHIWRVSPYAIGGHGRHWFREVGFDLDPRTASGKAGFLGAGIDVQVDRRLIAFAEARISGLARSGNDGDPVGGAKVGVRLGF